MTPFLAFPRGRGKGLLGAILALLAATTVTARAEERILDFASEITVDRTGALTVTETIAVQAEGYRIQHGIFRDFPTTYDRALGFMDRLGLPRAVPLLRVTVPFDVRDVQRDGRPEPYHEEALDNGERVYFGRSDAMVPPGRHTYVLTYGTARQLGFFADHDELYWNVTGNGWQFPIDHASATVRLPAEIPRDRIRLRGYTGPQGSRQHDLTASIDPRSGALHFETTAPLDPHEGLTIVAAFPVGFIDAPTQRQRQWQLVRDNPVLAFGPAGIVLVALYYFGAWLLVGRDPARGTVIPLFEPPLDLEPAALRFVAGMGYDERCFTAALVSLAAKGWVRISEDAGTFTLTRTGSRQTQLGIGERRLNKVLLTGESFEVAQRNHDKISTAIRGLREALRLEYDGKMFRANRRWVIPGLVLSVLVILGAGLSSGVSRSLPFVFIAIWVSIWSFACFHLVTTVVRAWRDLLRPGRGTFARIGAGIGAVIASVIALPFLAGEVFGLGVLIQTTSVLLAPLLLVLVGVNALFYYLLKQPTVAGRKVMDQIDGFRMYLTTAEGAELARAAPAKTPELYERLLPYAIALDVENEWAEQFSEVLARAAQSDGGGAYHPSWYSGTSFDRAGSTHFASAFSSSLSSSVASSSTAPGSSSGSSGGGSAGGGGGGGGGGGW